MDPYQQNQGTPGPQPPQGNPYEFILNPDQSPGRKRFGFGRKNNMALILALIVGGALIFMVIVALLLNALAPKKISKNELVNLTQTQNELIRISDQGSRDARQQVTKNLATTIQYSLMTQQKKTLDLLAKNGTKVGKKELALKQKASIDQQFTSAKATSTFDTVFAKIAEEELTSYANELKQLFEKAAGPIERDLMSDYYRQTQQLISQVPYTQDGIEAAGQ